MPPLEDNTRLFDVGAELCADDAADVPVRSDRVAEGVATRAKPAVGLDLAVEPVDDCERDVVAVDPEPAV